MARIHRGIRTARGFHVMREAASVAAIMPEPPKDGECFRIFSQGEFSALGFIRHFGDLCGVRHLTTITLVVGSKHLQALDVMRMQGKLGGADFLVGKMQANRDKMRGDRRYQYNSEFEAICKKNGWSFAVVNTHAKVYLLDTLLGHYVVESSANLNSNPWMEQYTIERSQELYAWYREIWRDMKEVADRGKEQDQRQHHRTAGTARREYPGPP